MFGNVQIHRKGRCYWQLKVNTLSKMHRIWPSPSDFVAGVLGTV